eukprot:1136722-Pelagomonas_calceolata.AAC.10
MHTCTQHCGKRPRTHKQGEKMLCNNMSSSAMHPSGYATRHQGIGIYTRHRPILATKPASDASLLTHLLTTTDTDDPGPFCVPLSVPTTAAQPQPICSFKPHMFNLAQLM